MTTKGNGQRSAWAWRRFDSVTIHCFEFQSTEYEMNTGYGIASGPAVDCGAVRRPSIQYATDRMEGAVRRCAELVDQLHGRFSSVLGPSQPLPAQAKNDSPGTPGCDLASFLHGQVNILDNSLVGLSALMDRCEL
jgi:hypothetical protein